MAVAGRSTREQAHSRRVCSLNRRRRPCRSVVASHFPPSLGPWPSRPCQRLVEPNQLLLAREVDLDASALSLTDDANARTELNLEFLFRGARVDVGRCRGAHATRRWPAHLVAFERRL